MACKAAYLRYPAVQIHGMALGTWCGIDDADYRRRAVLEDGEVS
jgi:hypothetical protein